MNKLEILNAIAPFISIGLFSSIVSRFSGANLSILVFCALIYTGTSPVETASIMITYLIFTKLTLHTQKYPISFKRLRAFKGILILLPIFLILFSLIIYPFAALIIFILTFMLEIMTQTYEQIPVHERFSIKEIALYTTISSILMIIPFALTKYITYNIYYMTGGIIALMACAFFKWIGDNRTRLQNTWDKIIIISFILSGFFGFDFTDWFKDMKRLKSTRFHKNLSLIVFPTFFITLIMSNILFGMFSLSGLCTTFFTAMGIRFFGYYEMSEKGKFNIIALAITVLAVLILFLTNPHPTNAAKIVDSLLQSNLHLKGLLNM